MGKYINPYTDFGFKKLFAQEANKDLLIDFLNQLLPEHHQIADLSFYNPEYVGDFSAERKAIFDIHCSATSGERFIVEMQKASLKYFKDRSLFYVTFPIRDQAIKGEWNFKLSTIYFVAVLDFEYDDEAGKQKFRRDVSLKDQDGDVFYEKLHFRFLQMPLFNKKEHELETKFDKWCYFLKNLANFDSIPQILNEPVFQKAFEEAGLANLSGGERKHYEESLIQYWDLKGVVDTAIEKRSVEIAKNAIEKGADDVFVADITGLSLEQVQEIRSKIYKSS